MSANSEKNLLRIIIAFLLPPLAVYLNSGITLGFFLNILLTILGWIPGVVHALLVLLVFPRD